MLRVFGAYGMYLVQTEHLTIPSQHSVFCAVDSSDIIA